MNARLAAAFLATLPCASLAVNLTINDTCSSSVTGSLAGTASLAADPSGNVTVNGFGGAGFSMGIGQCESAAANERPKCVLIASPNAVEPGGTVTFYAKCRTPSTINSYVWAGPTIPAAPGPGPSSTFAATFANPGVYSYSVAGTNANGTGNTSPQVNVLVAPAASATIGPACTVTWSPNLIVQNTPSNYKVSCQPEASSYTWDAPETGAPAASGVSGTLTFPAPGAFTYKVRGNNAQGGVGPKASATVNVTSDGSCVPGPYYAELPAPLGFSQDAQMPPNYVIAWSFSVAPGDYASLALQNHTQYNYFTFPNRGTIAISKCRGDFNVPPACTTGFFSWGWSQTLPGNGSANTTAGSCSLDPNTTYYLNVKPTDCANSPVGQCGFRIYRQH
jgi:plastocyanin